MHQYAPHNIEPVFQIDDLHGICAIRLGPCVLNSRFSRRDSRAISSIIRSRKAVVLDFSDVSGIDAAGSEMLMQWISASRERHGGMCFTHCSPQVTLMMQLLRIPQWAPILSDFRAAAGFLGIPLKFQRAV
jgi:ABC-type transporter Mla MlaB component